MSDCPFALLNLPPTFHIETAELDAHYFQAQLRYHPDKFSNAPDVDKMYAEKKSAEINTAYQTLQSPIQRAKVILKKNGIPFDATTPTAEVLEKSMDRRMQIETMKNDDALQAFSITLMQEWKKMLHILEKELEQKSTNAINTLMHLVYIEKAQEDLKKK